MDSDDFYFETEMNKIPKQVYLTKEQLDKLKELGWKSKKNASEIIREAIDEYLRKGSK